MLVSLGTPLPQSDMHKILIYKIAYLSVKLICMISWYVN